MKELISELERVSSYIRARIEDERYCNWLDLIINDIERGYMKTIRCPNCPDIYQVENPSQDFVRCMHCGRFYIPDQCREDFTIEDQITVKKELAN